MGTSPLLAIIAVAMAIVVNVLMPPSVAKACFFDCSLGDYGSGKVLDGGVYVTATPSNPSIAIHNFISLLQSYYYDGNTSCNQPSKNRAGAAYIVRFLLGDGNSYTVTPQNWADLEARLQPSNGVTIDWNGVASISYDTYSSRHYHAENSCPDPYDVNKYSHAPVNMDSIIISQVGRGVIAVIQKICANPDGNSPGSLQAKPQDFNLTPTITGSPSSTEGSGTATLSGSVNNTGNGSPDNVTWKVLSFRVDKGGTVPATATGSADPTTYFAAGTKNLATVSSGTSTFPSKVTTTIPIASQAIGDYDVGTKICYSLSVKPYTDTSTDWRYGTPFCVTISKKPKVQVLGSDLVVGKGGVGVGEATSNIQTSTTTKDIGGSLRTFGSWGEYALSATGKIIGMGSGSSYSGGLVNATSCQTTLLSFTNNDGASCTTSKVGSYKPKQTLPDISSAFLVNKGTFTGLGDANNPGTYTAASDFSIGGGTIAKGKWLVINAPTATVTITGSITYDNANLSSINDIPQLVIIAKNILIQNSVQNIDAWLVASGNINTCSDVIETAPLNEATCANRLTVNGPVVAAKLFLRRTFGAGIGATTGDPAEVFNLRPDAYLWAIARSSESGRIQTVYTQELPPRF
jgi:hypothetical protein